MDSTLNLIIVVRTSGLKSQDTSPSDEALETPQSDEAAVAAAVAESVEDQRDSGIDFYLISSISYNEMFREK